MSLLTEARAVQVGPGPQCQVAGLDPELVAEINTALNEPGLFATSIARVLKDRGLDISPETLNRHKRGDCKCPR